MAQTVNFYAGSRLNRLSWLRQNASFLTSTLTQPTTRFVLLKNLNPLAHADESSALNGKLATLSWSDVAPAVLGSLPPALRGQDASKCEVFGPKGSLIDDSVNAGPNIDVKKQTEGLVPPQLALVFLGIDESATGAASLPGQPASSAAASGTNTTASASAPTGTPYFALSLTYRAPEVDVNTKSPVQELLQKLENTGKYNFVDTRSLAGGAWDDHDAGVVAQARSLIDWNERNTYCPGCASRMYALWGGYKRSCISLLGSAVHGSALEAMAKGSEHVRECPSGKGLQNYNYPRTDPVIIMAIVSPENDKVLLGRQKTWPKGECFYSCLAGFVEPGEALEQAVRREVLEEAGIQLGKIVYHSSQPWPFPANMMAGLFAEAVPGEKIRLDLDNELEDARFFSRAEVVAALQRSGNSALTQKDLEGMDANVKALVDAEGNGAKKQIVDKGEEGAGKVVAKDEGSVAAVDAKDKVEGIKVPAKTAVAGVLLASWARGDMDSMFGKAKI